MAHPPDVEPETSGGLPAGGATSPRGTAANAAVLSLSRAARSFTLYDPANEVVRTLISDYREKFTRALEGGALELEVHPFQLLCQKEVVYAESDRERSMAFRLFRDGVRRLIFDTGAEWSELVRLLEVLSIRYTGVRQQEDDVVTLLRKAGFRHIHLTAVEGFVPQEEQAEPEDTSEILKHTGSRRDAPADWDLPVAPFTAVAPLRHQVVPAEWLTRLGQEESAEALPVQVLRAVAELLEAAGGQPPEGLMGFATEAREFLLMEKRPDYVADVALRMAWAQQANPTAAQAFLTTYLDEPTLDAMLAASQQQGAAPDNLLRLMDGAPPAVTDRILGLLLKEGGGQRAAILRSLAVRGCRRSPEVLTARLRKARGAEAVGLLGLVAEIDAAAAQKISLELGGHRDAEVQLAVLPYVEQLPAGPEVLRVARQMMSSTSEEVRIQATRLLALRGGQRVFPVLQAQVDGKAATLSPEEGEALGEALARTSSRQALDLFHAWLDIKGLLGRIGGIRAAVQLQHVALGGLRVIGGEEAEGLLDLLAEKGSADVKEPARRALAGRQGGRS